MGITSGETEHSKSIELVSKFQPEDSVSPGLDKKFDSMLGKSAAQCCPEGLRLHQDSHQHCPASTGPDLDFLDLREQQARQDYSNSAVS